MSFVSEKAGDVWWSTIDCLEDNSQVRMIKYRVWEVITQNLDNSDKFLVEKNSSKLEQPPNFSDIHVIFSIPQAQRDKKMSVSFECVEAIKRSCNVLLWIEITFLWHYFCLLFRQNHA